MPDEPEPQTASTDTDEQPTTTVEQQDPPPQYVTKEDFGAFQGRFAQITGQRMKDIQEAAAQAVREALAEEQRSSTERAEYIRELEQQGLDEDQIRAVVEANNRRKPAPQPKQTEKPAATEYQDGLSWSAEERNQLGRRVTGLLDGLSLDVDVQDQRLWTGLSTSMSPDEAYAIAKKNAQSLKTPPAETRSTEQRNTSQQNQQTETPPPTTQNAPTESGAAYESKADAAADFVAGKINIDEYKEALAGL